ncbi:MAG: hypothetical protein ACOVNV_00695, partial [Pirellulaceae bacterium]
QFDEKCAKAHGQFAAVPTPNRLQRKSRAKRWMWMVTFTWDQMDESRRAVCRMLTGRAIGNTGS